MSKGNDLRSRAVELLGDSPQGIRYVPLIRKLAEDFPGTPRNTITGAVWNLDETRDKEVYKAARGLFRHLKFKDVDATEVVTGKQTPTEDFNEQSFYQPFADYLQKELGECTKAIALGGNKFKDKWGTPDVIGVREARKSDIIKPPTEIVSAEIKLSSKPDALITAFGQACAYKLFSHKSYLVVPVASDPVTVERLDALCRIVGIGLILFDAGKPSDPDFEIRVRAAKHEPDMVYVNNNIKEIEPELFS